MLTQTIDTILCKLVWLCSAYGLLVSQMNPSDTDTSIFCIMNMHLRISQQLQHTVNTHHVADTKLDCSCNNHSFKVAQRGKYMHLKLVQALDLPTQLAVMSGIRVVLYTWRLLMIRFPAVDFCYLQADLPS